MQDTTTMMPPVKPNGFPLHVSIHGCKCGFQVVDADHWRTTIWPICKGSASDCLGIPIQRQIWSYAKTGHPLDPNALVLDTARVTLRVRNDMMQLWRPFGSSCMTLDTICSMLSDRDMLACANGCRRLWTWLSPRHHRIHIPPTLIHRRLFVEELIYHRMSTFPDNMHIRNSPIMYTRCSTQYYRLLSATTTQLALVVTQLTILICDKTLETTDELVQSALFFVC